MRATQAFRSVGPNSSSPASSHARRRGRYGPSSLVAHRMPTRCDSAMNRRLKTLRQGGPQVKISRFAPSPTGRLHLGHAYSAVLGHARAKENGGGFLLRIEDLDQTRSRPEFVDGIYEDLRWLNVEWDQPVLVQSQRSSEYEAALGQLRTQGLVYACFCTRADIAT